MVLLYRCRCGTEKDEYQLAINSVDEYYSLASDLDSSGGWHIPFLLTGGFSQYDEPQNIVIKAETRIMKTGWEKMVKLLQMIF